MEVRRKRTKTSYTTLTVHCNSVFVKSTKGKEGMSSHERGKTVVSQRAFNC